MDVDRAWAQALLLHITPEIDGALCLGGCRGKGKRPDRLGRATAVDCDCGGSGLEIDRLARVVLSDDTIAALRELIERWRAEGVEVSREDVTEAIARHRRVAELQSAVPREPSLCGYVKCEGGWIRTWAGGIKPDMRSPCPRCRRIGAWKDGG